MLLKMTSGARPFWIEQLLIKVANKHLQLHFLPYSRASKEERESCSSDTASQHWAQESDGLKYPLILSKQPRASVVLERASCWSHTQLTLPGQCMFSPLFSAGKVATSTPLSLRLPEGLWQWPAAHHHLFMHTYALAFPFPFVAFQPWGVNCYCITCVGEEENSVPMISVRVQGIYEMWTGLLLALPVPQ